MQGSGFKKFTKWHCLAKNCLHTFSNQHSAWRFSSMFWRVSYMWGHENMPTILTLISPSEAEDRVWQTHKRTLSRTRYALNWKLWAGLRLRLTNCWRFLNRYRWCDFKPQTCADRSSLAGVSGCCLLNVSVKSSNLIWFIGESKLTKYSGLSIIG